MHCGYGPSVDIIPGFGRGGKLPRLQGLLPAAFAGWRHELHSSPQQLPLPPVAPHMGMAASPVHGAHTCPSYSSPRPLLPAVAGLSGLHPRPGGAGGADQPGGGHAMHTRCAAADAAAAQRGARVQHGRRRRQRQGHAALRCLRRDQSRYGVGEANGNRWRWGGRRKGAGLQREGRWQRKGGMSMQCAGRDPACP